MKPAPFSYHAPSTLDECLRLLDKYGDDAVLLAGGQSLLPMLRFRIVQPAHVISIRGIGGALRTIRKTDNGLAIGAAVTYSAAQRSNDVLAVCPDLADVIDLVAHPAVRARGTLCGNLCQADPASEMPALTLAMGARFKLSSLAGERVVMAEDYFIGPYLTARRSGEILSAVEFPQRPAGESVVVKEVTRLRGGFPLSGVVVALTRGAGTNLRSVALACFGVHFKQLRLREAEAALEAGGYTDEAIAAAASAIDRAIEPQSDPYASAAYRRSATNTLFRRAIAEAYEKAAH
jgi:aerobic carbon-monoxide dehydrogenase medium subunit